MAKNTVSNITSLQARIRGLEQRESQQVADLKETAANIVESVKPVNLIKSALKGIGSSPGLKSTALDTVIGIGSGFLGRKLYVGGSKNIFRKIAGSAVQFVVTNFVRKKIPQIRENNNGHHSEES